MFNSKRKKFFEGVNVSKEDAKLIFHTFTHCNCSVPINNFIDLLKKANINLVAPITIHHFDWHSNTIHISDSENPDTFYHIKLNFPSIEKIVYKDDSYIVREICYNYDYSGNLIYIKFMNVYGVYEFSCSFLGKKNNNKNFEIIVSTEDCKIFTICIDIPADYNENTIYYITEIIKLFSTQSDDQFVSLSDRQFAFNEIISFLLIEDVSFSINTENTEYLNAKEYSISYNNLDNLVGSFSKFNYSFISHNVLTKISVTTKFDFIYFEHLMQHIREIQDKN